MMPLACLVIPQFRPRRGVTLVQLLLAIAIVTAISSFAIPTYNRAKANANRQRCDMQLKTIALALDAYRQSHHKYPTTLKELESEPQFKAAAHLHCPNDPREVPSYEEFYVLRSRDDGTEVPVLMCPFHESTGHGNQARIGTYTTQFATRPAILESGNAVTVEAPGQNERMGYAGMELHGGDTVTTSGNGSATITFTDGSQAVLNAGTTVTVLQSFIDGRQSAPLYTVLRQTTGIARYTVHHGSRFDVTTPTATAGARGTEFIISITTGTDGQPNTVLQVTEGKVAFTGGTRTVIVKAGGLLDVEKLLKGLLNGLGNLLG